MLIVEGPDGAGKTRLVGMLEEALGIQREPRAVSSDAEALKPLKEYVTDELARGFGPRIYDRFALISSPFYSMLPNPTFAQMNDDREWLEGAWMTYRRVSPMVVVCLPPLEVVRHNVRQDPKNQVVAKDIDVIHGLYFNFVAQYPWVDAIWDYTQNVIGDLNSFLWHFKQRVARAERTRNSKLIERGYLP